MRDESSVPTKYAPERFRTRVFRDLAQDFGNIVESAATVTFDKISDFLHGIGEALKVIIEVSERMQGLCRWDPPTSEARSRRRRWLQGCEEVDEAPRQRVLVEARRMERHAQRHLTQHSPALRYKPPRSRVAGFLRLGGQPRLLAAKAPHRQTTRFPAGLALSVILEVPQFLRELPSLRNAPRGFNLFEAIIVLLG